ncbi:MAG: hypothetical protein ACPGLV_16545, partial [Bacteroidia bacterium]
NIAFSGESALQALHHRGVEYIEVRLLDIDPFSENGISKESIEFMHVFLLGCLLLDAPTIDGNECNEIDENHLKVVNHGRDPNLKLLCDKNNKRPKIES